MIKSSFYFYRIGLLVFAVLVYCYVPVVQEFFRVGIIYLRHRDFEGLRQFILAFGGWAPAISIALMMIQSLFPVVPGLIMTITNAWIFGWLYGAFYSWVGGLLGAMLDFGIARWYGRLVVEGLLNSKYLHLVDEFLKKHGLFTVFVTRLTPIIPFKVVSYGAGLTTMSWWRFMIATAMGQAPAIILYSVLGQNITHHLRLAIAVTLLLLGIVIVIYHYRKEIICRLFPERKP